MNAQEMVVIIRPSFKKICGPDAARAAIYNHILYRLARKAKDEPDKKVREGEVFWFASAEDICQDMDEAWCVNKVRKEIKALVDSGLLGQRHNPVKRWDRKFQYFIGKEQGKKLLELSQKQGVCLLHIGLNAEVLHLLHMVNAFTKNGACKCQKEEMHLPDMALPSTKYGGAIPEGSSEGSSPEGSQEKKDAIAIAHARALFADDIENLPDEPIEDDPEATIKAPLTPASLKVAPPPNAPDNVADASKETAKQKKARLDKRKEEILALYCQLLDRKIVRSKDNLEGARLLAESEASDAEITQTYQTYKDHAFWGSQLHLKNIARLLDTTVSKAIPTTSAKPVDVYTAASMDKERNQRNYEKLVAKRLAREAEAQQGVNHGTN